MEKKEFLLVDGGQAVNTDPELTQVLLSQRSIRRLPLPHNILQALPQMGLIPFPFICFFSKKTQKEMTSIGLEEEKTQTTRV